MDGSRLGAWQGFLADEGVGEDGLLCFYDVHKSPAVARCCGVLAQHLRSFWDEFGEPAAPRLDNQEK